MAKDPFFARAVPWVRIAPLPAEASRHPDAALPGSSGGVPLQTSDGRNGARTEPCVVAKLAPTAAQIEGQLLAWKVARFVESDAVVF